MADQREKRPPREWAEIDSSRIRGAAGVLELSAWQLGRTCVISSLDLAELPDGSGEVGPQWHISITAVGNRRAKPEQVRRALRAFGMVGAEEDNHHPGNARHFFMPVDPARRVDCECKATDENVIDPDGYRWTNDKSAGADPSVCRGCEIAPVTGRPCAVHGLEVRDG